MHDKITTVIHIPYDTDSKLLKIKIFKNSWVYSIGILKQFFAFMKSEGIRLRLFKIHLNFRVFNWDFKLYYKIRWYSIKILNYVLKFNGIQL